jgi:hypothetical protein
VSPRSKAAKPTIESVLDDSITTLDIALRHIRGEIEKIAAGKAKKTQHDPASRIAYLSGGVGRVLDSLRKVESARAKRFDDITSSVVLNYLRGLDASERGQIIREAIAIDERKSGLA